MRSILAPKSIVALLFVIGVTIAPTEARVCEALHVGTDTTNVGTKNDIISKGATNKMWSKDSFAPVIVTHSKKIEYFYLVDVDLELTSKSIKLSYDNEQYANSSVHLKKEPNHKNWYALEVIYNCEAYGGALLTYTLEINVPNCGTSSFVWKKVCGFPLTPLDGFTIDMAYNETTVNIVKNGMPANDNFWDAEVEDWAIKIPAHIDTLNMDIYMNSEDMARGVGTLAGLGGRDTDADASRNKVAEATVNAPRVDSDDAIAFVSLRGPLEDNQGGTITRSKSQLVLQFECQAVQGSSTVEFMLPLSNFRDINLYFYKECNNASSVFASLYFWLFIVVLVVAYKVYDNIKKGNKGTAAVPGFDKARDLVGRVVQTGSGTLAKYSKANTGRSPHSSHSSHEDDAETGDFNIKNMDEMKRDDDQYGTI